MKRFFQLKPFFYQSWELYIMKAGFALVLYLSLPDQVTLSSQPHPNGLGHFIDFSFLSLPGVWTTLLVVTALALPFYVFGIFSVPALTWMTFITIASGTLQNSQGAIFHGYQPIALIALGQWITSLFGLFSRPGGYRRFWIDDLPGQRILAGTAMVILVSCYVSSAITKMERTDGQWIWRTPDLAVQIAKTNYDAYYSKGKEVGELAKKAPRWMAENPVLTRMIIGPALLLELLAFVALLGRIPALVVGLALIAMHQGIDGIMQLNFWAWELLVLILLVNIPHWIVLLFRKVVPFAAKNTPAVPSI